MAQQTKSGRPAFPAAAWPVTDPFAGPGEMRARCRALDWGATPLGPVAAWPAALRTIAGTVLGAPIAMVVLWGPEHVQVYNDAYREIMGAKHPAGLGQPTRACWPEVWEFNAPILDGVLRRGESSTVTDQRLLMARDGAPSEAYVTLAFGPVPNDDGTVGGVLATLVETTAHVRARDARELALHESERRLRAIFDGTYESIGLLAPDGTLLEVNRAALAVGACARADVVGRPFCDGPWFSGTPGASEHVRAAVARAAQGEFVRWEAPVRRPDGEWRTFDISLHPVRDEHGAVVLIVPEGRDVTHRQRAEAERTRLLAEAEAANRGKSEFLAVMSHELRTPLNAIGGYAELLELGVRGPITDAQRIDLGRIRASQRHLLGLINQVLNYTRVDAGAVRYDPTDVSVAEALAAAEALVLPQAHARHLSCRVEECAGGLYVRADREKLQQVLLNLLSNAIKFTEPGGEVRVTCTATEDAIAVAVADTGIGIAPEKLAHVFEPFVQVDQRLTRPHEGVGLGLAISRELARGMGGDLSATSVAGAGSVFTLTLPPARPA